MKYVYPVIFTQTADCVLVDVPVLDIQTEGTDMADAISMARDSIGLKGITLEDQGLEIPKPTKDIKKESNFSSEGDSLVSFVDIDFSDYRRMIDNRTVRKNVTLPSWLNYKAEQANVNFSKILQDGLISYLGLEQHH
ncbi:type II toxin-antitoxin system HicB family antitoxin [Velocimicrobium porci]|uniref:HicB family protein n=1 Tax=Velocimicrobium porci TaxID=2606634 RepID=A0A6L5XWD8_9FIRM|nr:type II toxin-antitoxin system HicB family antitoxin [Velocimicrobium porci]MSS63150.1 HicB family protein [Velocimicrobium porci]